MNSEQLQVKLTEIGLGKYYDRLLAMSYNSIRLYLNPTSEDQLKIGQSKIGGRPDLPQQMEWPTETREVIHTEKKFFIFTEKKKETVTKPVSFIAQINCSEAAPFDNEGLLPKTGMLYFFYAADQDVWGFDPKDKDAFKVLYYDGSLQDLQRAEFPSDLESTYKPTGLRMNEWISLPTENDLYDQFTDEQSDDFEEQVRGMDMINKVLGHSDNVQNEMELECELVTNGLNCGDPSGYNDPKAKMLEPNAKHWRLLLQIDSNEENDMMWGDCGRLYFWIKKDDLLNKRFDKCWFNLQCS